MSRQLLLQSILGHLSLLAEKHPKKAATPVARRTRKYVVHALLNPPAARSVAEPAIQRRLAA